MKKLILINSLILFFVFSFTKTCFADSWYDANYNYRRPISVTNNIGSSLTDFQVKLSIDTSTLIGASKMNNDCSDIRFTDEDKTTSLNYFIQSGCNTTSTVIWVKVPSLPASTSKDIYMYYGYSSATAATNGDNTFDFFDDFTGTTLDSTKWTDWNPQTSGTMNISGGTLSISMTTTGGYSTVRHRGVISTSAFAFPTSGSLIETYSKWTFASPGSSSQYNGVVKSVTLFDSSSPTGICGWQSYSGGGNAYSFGYMRYYGFFGIGLNQFTFGKCTNNSYTEVAKYNYGTSSSWSNPSNFVLEQYRWFDSSGTKEGMRRSDNVGVGWTSDLWAQQSQTLLTLPNSYYLSFNLQNRSTATHSVLLDWYRIRKYASTEPSSSVGSEQAPQTAPVLPTLISPTNTATSVSQTPTFKTVSTDANDDSLQYEIKICTNSDMNSNCNTFTAANTGWSGADVGTTSYSTGTTAVYIISTGSSLASNTTYYWKTRAIDVDGSNTWSDTQTNPYSFTTLNNIPSTPTNTTPGVGVTAISFTPTLTASSFSDLDVGDTQSASQWQIATDSGFTSVIWDTGTTGPTSNTTTVSSSLNIGTNYYWRVRYLDSHSGWSNYSNGTMFTTNQAPSAPTLILPTNSATGVTLTPIFQIVASDPDTNNLQYKIVLGTNSAFTGTTQVFNQSINNTGWSNQNIGTSAYSSGTTAVYTISVGNSLATNTTYYWKAQAFDYSGSNSWSVSGVEHSFITRDTDPNTPTNTTPSSGATGVSLTPILTASTFSDPDIGDSQSASQWQVATDSNFNNIVWDTGTTGPASNTTTVNSSLNIGTTYYWHVRYQDSHNSWSNYSTGTMFVTNKSPSTPILISPSNSATNISLTPSFQLVAGDPDNDNLQYKIILGTNSAFTGTTQVFNQVVNNVGWSAQNIGTSAYSSGTTAVYIISAGSSLTSNTIYYWKAQTFDYSGSNSWSNLSIGYSFTTTNSSPNQPTNSTPTNSANHISFTPTLIASSFSDTDIGDTQSASQWQVATDSNFNNIIWDTGTTGPASNTTVVTTTLSVGTSYYWHVRYLDSHATWSNYSTATSFLTNRAPITPANVFPANGASSIPLLPTFMASDFSDPDIGDSHTATQLQVATDINFNNIVWDTGSTNPFTSIAIPTPLNFGTTYFWHVRYENNPWSEYSPTSYFTTLSGGTIPANNSFKIKGVKLKGVKFQ